MRCESCEKELTGSLIFCAENFAFLCDIDCLREFSDCRYCSIRPHCPLYSEEEGELMC